MKQIIVMGILIAMFITILGAYGDWLEGMRFPSGVILNERGQRTGCIFLFERWTYAK